MSKNVHHNTDPYNMATQLRHNHLTQLTISGHKAGDFQSRYSRQPDTTDMTDSDRNKNADSQKPITVRVHFPILM